MKEMASCQEATASVRVTASDCNLYKLIVEATITLQRRLLARFGVVLWSLVLIRPTVAIPVIWPPIVLAGARVVAWSVALAGLIRARVVVSLALVADVGHVARVAVDVVLHRLPAAVGQVVVVSPFGVVTITRLPVTKVVAVVVLDLVAVLVLGLLGLVGLVRALKGRNMDN